VAENAAFSWKSQFSTRQYSDAYIDWIVERAKANPDFF
jgi:hypothetical protein